MNNYNDWIMDRCGKITASEIHKIMGKGRSKDAYFGQLAETYMLSKIAEILTLEPINGGRMNTDAMDWGNAHESDAAAAFQQKHPHLNLQYYGVINPKFFEYNQYCGGSPDGVFTAATGDNGIIEIKCPYNSTEHVRHLLITDAASLLDIAPEYYWQMVANMLFTETRIGYFISFDPRMALERLQLHVVPIEPIDGHIELIKERIAEASKWILTNVNILNDTL
jgi:hypothetical protein